MKRPLALATLTLALAAASVANAEEPSALPAPATSAAPEVRYPPPSVRPKLIVGGLAISGLAYAAAFGAAASWPEVPGSAQLKIPFAGPWLALGQSGCAADDPDCGAKIYLRGVLYVIGGIAQLAGLGLIGEGIFMKTEAPRQSKSLALSLQPVPMVTARFTGLGLVGSF